MNKLMTIKIVAAITFVGAILISGCIQEKLPNSQPTSTPMKEYANFATMGDYDKWHRGIYYNRSLTEAQKRNLLAEINGNKGKYVSWEGFVEDVYSESYVGTGAITIKNQKGCFLCSSVYLDDLNIDKKYLLSINKGDIVKFEGMFYDDNTLRDVTILSIRGDT